MVQGRALSLVVTVLTRVPSRGEAMVTSQPLVTKALAGFLCEINYAFDTMALLEYREAPAG